jgi:hypothetical protein
MKCHGEKDSTVNKAHKTGNIVAIMGICPTCGNELKEELRADLFLTGEIHNP